MFVTPKIPTHTPYLTFNARPRRVATPAKFPKRTVVCQSAFTDSLVQGSYYAGKALVLFPLFYFTMNWWFYKRLNDDAKKHKDEDKK